MTLDHSKLGLEKNSWKTNQAEFFAFDKFTSQNLANKSGGVYKSTFYTFYTTHLRPIYHTDLGQNEVFHSFSRQLALSQYSGRSIVVGF